MFLHSPRHAVAAALAWTVMLAFLLAGSPAREAPAAAVAWALHDHAGGEEGNACEQAPVKPRRQAALRVSTTFASPQPPSIVFLPASARRAPASRPPPAMDTPPPRKAPGLRQQRGQAPPLA